MIILFPVLYNALPTTARAAPLG